MLNVLFKFRLISTSAYSFYCLNQHIALVPHAYYVNTALF